MPRVMQVSHAERLDALDHGDDRVHVAVLRTAPGGAHAEARRTGILGGLGLGNDLLDFHQLLGRKLLVVMGALRTVVAVLRAGRRF